MQPRVVAGMRGAPATALPPARVFRRLDAPQRLWQTGRVAARPLQPADETS